MNKPGRARWVFFQGRTRRLADAIRLSGIRHSTVEERLRRGWSMRRALETPTGPAPVPAAPSLADQVAELRAVVDGLRLEVRGLKSHSRPGEDA